MNFSTVTFRRFLSARAFLSDLKSLYVFGFDHVDEGMLEELERHGGLTPRRRLHFPPEVARRLWHEEHEGTRSVARPLEQDGERWNAAVVLWNALFRWQNRSIYGVDLHPLDTIEHTHSEFISFPDPLCHRPWDELRVDVSSDSSQHLFTSSYSENYYAPWQLLVASEIADAGLFYRVNLLNEETWDKAQQCLFEKKAPSTSVHFKNSGCLHARYLIERDCILDAVVWFVEECDFSLRKIIPRVAGRYKLAYEENERYLSARHGLAAAAVAQFNIQEEDLTNVLGHMINRWANWNRIGRPLIADAYKVFGASTANLLMLAFDVSIEKLKEKIGEEFTKIWPDWGETQSERLSITLRTALNDSIIDKSRINEFARFLIEHGLESFYWRLLSFEDQVFRGNEFSFGGLRSDLQGLAVAVEHVVRKLGGAKGQLIEMFKQLWQRRDVADLLAAHAWTARKGADALPWADFKQTLDELRRGAQAGPVVADLLMAQRIRGTVHFSLPIDDDFEVEQLFVGLIRAAYATYAEVKDRSN